MDSNKLDRVSAHNVFRCWWYLHNREGYSTKNYEDYNNFLKSIGLEMHFVTHDTYDLFVCDPHLWMIAQLKNNFNEHTGVHQ